MMQEYHSDSTGPDRMLSTIKKVQHQIDGITRYLSPLLPLANCHMVEFLTQNHWETLLPEALRNSLECSELNDTVEQFWKSAGNSCVNGETELQSWISKARAHYINVNNEYCLSTDQLQDRILSWGGDLQPGIKVTEFMNSKKSYEVSTMSRLVSSLYSATSSTCCIEAGGGRGHLLVALSLGYNIPSLTVDCDQSKVLAAAARVKIIQKQWQAISKRIQPITDDPLSNSSANSSSVADGNISNNIQSKIEQHSNKTTNTTIEEKDNFDTNMNRHSNTENDSSDIIRNMMNININSSNNTNQNVYDTNKGSPNTNLLDTNGNSSDMFDTNGNFSDINQTMFDINKNSSDTKQTMFDDNGNSSDTNETMFHDNGNNSVTNQTMFDTNIKSSDRNQNKNYNCVKSKSNLHRFATAYITKDTDLTSVVQEKFPENSGDNKLLLTGLHTCGDLGPSSLRIFTSHRSTSAVFNVPCCYHLLSEGSGSGFPMSDYLKEYKLGRNARMLAAQSIDRVVNDRQLPSASLLYRALLQVLIKTYLPQGKVLEGKLKRLSKCDSFQEYFKMADAILNLGLFDRLPQSCLTKIYDEIDCHWRKLVLFYLIRLCLAQVIESLILLDRILYLYECGVEKAYLVKLFDPVLSPRCHGIVAVR